MPVEEIITAVTVPEPKERPTPKGIVQKQILSLFPIVIQ